MSKNHKGHLPLILAVIAFAVLGGGMFTIHKIRTSPRRMVNAIMAPMVRDIAADRWSIDALEHYSTPEFNGWLEQNAPAGMPGFAVLGPMKQYLGLKDLRTDEAEDFAVVVASFQFEKAPADLTLQMSKRNGRWLIYSFNIESPLLGNSKPNTTNGR